MSRTDLQQTALDWMMPSKSAGNDAGGGQSFVLIGPTSILSDPGDAIQYHWRHEGCVALRREGLPLA
jgi:hypothetical protein